MRDFWRQIKQFIIKYRLYALGDVLLFILITVGIHYLWRFWQVQFNYAPIRDFMYGWMDSMSTEVYRESVWIISGMYDIVRVDDALQFVLPNQCLIYINEGCSGLKQIIQFSLLLIVFPGPWKKKLWFIPLGMLIVHLTNLFRVVGLTVVMMNWPNDYDFSHDYIFRPIFYVVIFLMWMLWNDVIRKRTKGPRYQVPDTGKL
jgi:exosortase/archaeosortase family protein